MFFADIRTQAEDLRKQMLAGVGDGQMPLVKRLQNNFTKFLEVVCNGELQCFAHCRVIVVET